jgi:hypothetical protein
VTSGIDSARVRASVDLSFLLDRDHAVLDRAILSLLDARATLAQHEATLDALRVTFAAHADAEAIVLTAAVAQLPSKHDATALVAQVLAEHRIQESIMRRMDPSRPDDCMCAAIRLRRAIATHSDHEASSILNTLRESLPALEYQRLAQRFVAERARAVDLQSVLRPVTQRCATRSHRRAVR